VYLFPGLQEGLARKVEEREKGDRQFWLVLKEKDQEAKMGLAE
jgi:hypothetical protein